MCEHVSSPVWKMNYPESPLRLITTIWYVTVYQHHGNDNTASTNTDNTKISNTPIIVYSDKNDILSAAALVPSRLLPSRPPLLVSSLDLHRSERCINPLLHSLVLVVVQIQNTCASIARISTNFAPKSFNVPKKNIALSKNSCK